MQELKLTRGCLKRCLPLLAAVLVIAMLFYSMLEHEYVNSGFGQHIVYCRGWGLSEGNDSLLGYKITRVVSVLSDGEVREGRYLDSGRCSFRYMCNELVVVEGVTRIREDVVKLPDFTLSSGGYLYEAVSYDERGSVSGVVAKGYGSLVARTSDGKLIRQVYEDNTCRRYDVFRENKWETVWRSGGTPVEAPQPEEK